MDSADAFGLSPKIEAVEDVVAALDLAAPDQRLELLRDSLKKYGLSSTPWSSAPH